MAKKKLQFKVGDFVEGTKYPDTDRPWHVFGLIGKVGESQRISYLDLEKSSFLGIYKGQKVEKGSANAFYHDRDSFRKLSIKEVLNRLQSTWDEFEEEIFRSEHKYGMDELRFVFKMSYFNSASSKYFIHILRSLKNIENKGIPVRIEWHYEEGDEKMMEDGEDLAEAVEFEFEYHEMD